MAATDPLSSAVERPIVSIWVGAFPTVDEAETYFFKRDDREGFPERCRFANDLAFDYFDPACLEIHFEQRTPRPIRQLLDECTYSTSFGAEALAAAEAQGLSEAQGIALVYHADFRTNSVVRAAMGPLTFLGSFSLTGYASPDEAVYFQIARRLGLPSRAVFLVQAVVLQLSLERVGHVTAGEICHALLDRYEPSLLRECRLFRSEEVGRIVSALVQAGLLRAREGDLEADFAELFTVDPAPPANASPPGTYAAQARPERRRLQFTVRSVLAVILAASLLLLSWRMHVAPFRTQAETIDLINQLGGTYEAAAGSPWESRLAGFKLQSVTLVNLADCDEPDQYIDRIVRLPQLRTLVVGGPAFTDAHLNRLISVARLESLLLDSAAVSDEAVAKLEQLLPMLSIYRSDRRIIADLRKSWPGGAAALSRANGGMTPSLGPLIGPEFFVAGINTTVVTIDAQLAALPRATSVQKVILAGFAPDITAAGIAQLSRVRGLRDVTVVMELTPGALDELARLRIRSLDLSNSKPDDAQIAQLRDSTVEVLNLSETPITDTGVAHLAGLPRLQELCLAKTALTDAALPHFARIANLKVLQIHGTKINPEAAAKALPNCRIEP